MSIYKLFNDLKLNQYFKFLSCVKHVASIVYNKTVLHQVNLFISEDQPRF